MSSAHAPESGEGNRLAPLGTSIFRLAALLHATFSNPAPRTAGGSHRRTSRSKSPLRQGAEAASAVLAEEHRHLLSTGAGVAAAGQSLSTSISAAADAAAAATPAGYSHAYDLNVHAGFAKCHPKHVHRADTLLHCLRAAVLNRQFDSPRRRPSRVLMQQPLQWPALMLLYSTSTALPWT